MRRPRIPAYALAGGALALAAVAAGCHRDGCVGGDDGQCLPPSACAALKYAPTCSASPALRVEMIGTDPERAPGPKSLAAQGDYLLENDLIRVVIDAPEHPHDLAPSGGAILDLAPLAPGFGDQT